MFFVVQVFPVLHHVLHQICQNRTATTTSGFLRAVTNCALKAAISVSSAMRREAALKIPAAEAAAAAAVPPQLSACLRVCSTDDLKLH